MAVRASPTVEDYLHVIYQMSREGKPVIGSHLAEKMSVAVATTFATVDEYISSFPDDVRFHLEEIRRRHPKIKVVMLSASTTPDLIEEALRRGASAYVLKTVDPSDLPSTLRQVIGGTVFSTVGQQESSTPSGAKAAGLTEREVAILTELASGKSNDEIAKELWVTQQTVKFHLTNVYRKLGAKNRADAVRQAYQLGLIQRPLGDD